MIPESFRAFYIDELHQASIKDVATSNLPQHQVTIRVEYSSLNYKDALSARALNNVTKTYPHIPGIDAAGIVLEDVTKTFKAGDKVVVTGNDLGTNTFGGFGEIIRVPSNWVVTLSQDLTMLNSMIFGTAGFTALYGIHRLENEGIKSESGPVLVTGATGGVGSLAIFALAQRGFEVVASTRKIESTDFLIKLGANSVIHSNDIFPSSERPLQPRKWNACIDTVGGKLLDSVLPQIAPKGAVACCGNILGIQLNTNILPFILRGISLLGIDSAFCIRSIREQIWKDASSLPFNSLPDQFFKIVELEGISDEIDKILSGNQKGRVVIKYKKE